MSYFSQKQVLISILFSVFLVLLFQTTITKVQIDKNSRFFIDEQGRKRIYHGVNVVYKMFPFYPNLDVFDSQTSLTDEDFQNLKTWGINFFRLYVPWEGLETIRGQYNETLLEKIKYIVQKCEFYNISVLLDAHQDLLNRKFCGEGAPDWAIDSDDTFPLPVGLSIPKDENGYPIIKECLKKDFSEYYLSFDVSKAFQNLYKNQNGILDNFANMWKWVAQNFKDSKNVIGYEILNEPWFGNIYQHPGLLINSDIDDLQDFYEAVNNKIREADNDTVIFFEPSVADTFKISLTQAPGGNAYEGKQCLSYHVYCPLFISGSGNIYENIACKFVNDHFFDMQLSKAEELKVGSFLTEFGGLLDNEQNLKQISQVAVIAESKFQSWAYWQFKSYQDFTTDGGPQESFYSANGTLQSAKVKILARTYAYAIAGEPLSQVFDDSNGYFTFTFVPKFLESGVNTELYISEDFYYEKGFNTNFENCNSCQLRKLQNKYYYEIYIPKTEYQGQQITLSITPI